MERNLDIVVFGASGDTGIVGCCCLFFLGKKMGITSWAPAARNLSKLKKEVMDRFQGVAPGPDGLLPAEPIQADASDFSSLVQMCARAKCVISCAGPFTEFGEGVVRACIQAGTHYVDITGETPWVNDMQRIYGGEAEKNAVSILNCAGYDSVPSDLTTFLAAKALEEDGDCLKRFEAFVGCKGFVFPTGTVNTVAGGVSEAKRIFLNKASFGVFGAKAQLAVLAQPADPSLAASSSQYVPQVEQSNLRSNSFWTMWPAYSSLAGQFCIPHFMAPINVNAVHHTASREGYGGLVYRERMAGLPRGPLSLFGLLPTLAGVLCAVILVVLMPLPYFSKCLLKLRDTFNTRLQHRVRDSAFRGYESAGKTYVHGYGVSRSGRKVTIKLSSMYDPGLGFTMLSACTIAAQVVQRSGTPAKAKAGFLSPVVALGGHSLAKALMAMGVTIEYVSSNR